MYIELFFSLFTLTVLEIVLSIDNLVFLSIITSRLPIKQQPAARKVGLVAAMMMRLILLALANWLITLKTPLFVLFDTSFSVQSLIFMTGGLFLIWKSTTEIHENVMVNSDHNKVNINKSHPSFASVILQIMLLDLVFSLDSIFTAVGITHYYPIMATAIIISVAMLLFAAEFVCEFVTNYPSFKMLAISFLLLIGAVLFADGLGMHVPKGYMYFAICFSLFVEVLNSLTTRRKKSR
tara:strand:+ start:2965 stop:3675 length:711 start_codon:yes stop_codon:yes gene_type:complete